MSTVAIDTGRTNERLSAFLSEIATNDPVDNYFERFPVMDKLMSTKKTGIFGRQIQIPIDSGENSTVKDFSGYDVFDTSSQDTALTLVYPMVNKGGTLTISWEEEREVADNKHRIFDLLKHRRSNLIKTAMKKYSQDLFAAAQAADKITTFAVGIDSTGTLGGLSQATDADWASYETASGSFSDQGLSDMRDLYNDLWLNGCMPDTIITSQTVYQYYENEVDPDVRYSKAQGVGGRGFKSLEFKGVPITPDPNATSDVIYMMDSENVKLYVDSDGNFSFDPFVKPSDQKARTATFACRMQLVIDRRKSTGKMTSILP